VRYNQKADTKSLYIHWPFCPYRCHFCPFVALAGHEQFMGRYNRALCREIESFLETYEGPGELDTIFLGGGTPSTYPDNLLLDMSGTLRKVFSLKKEGEFTIEINPGVVKKEQLNVWRTVGINRLSIGVQSLKDHVLQKLNRQQTSADVYRLLSYAPNYFSNISVDIILGLPGVSNEEWKQLVRTVVIWPITHISVYFLTVHENTQLYFKVQANRLELPSDDTVIDLYYWTIDHLRAHGFEQYELSNFAKAGYESRHNMVYWDRKPYKAFGLGACSFDGTNRFQNEKSLMRYIECAERGEDTTTFYETVTSEQAHLETLMLGLRSRSGVQWQDALKNLSESKQQRLRQRVTLLKENALLREEDNCLFLTRAGLVIENEILTQLTQ
jgi:oxygen-independent coproporphyrinogen-3 oxidase